MMAAAVMMSFCACNEPVVTEMQESTVKTLRENLDAPKKEIPEEGWTQKSLMKVIKLGKKEMKFPCTMADLDSLFEYSTDGRFYVSDDGDVYGDLLYDSCDVGNLKLLDAPDKANYKKGKVKMIMFKAEEYGDDKNWAQVYPISINGVTIGSSAAEIEERLGFKTTGVNNFSISQQVGDIRLVFTGSKIDGVTSIAITNTKLGFAPANTIDEDEDSNN